MKKIVSFLLVAVLMFSLLPLSVFADSEVISISYKTEYHQLIEDLDGEWDQNDNYFRYYCNFHEGDELTVNYSTGEPKVFVAEFIDGEIYFTAEGEEPILQWHDIFTSNNQSENHWTQGNTYEYRVEYAGVSTAVNVEIIKNPVVSISYTPRDPVIRYFEAGGSVNTDGQGNEYYHYSVIGNNSDDVLTVTYEDRTVDYKCEFDPEFRYVSENGDSIDASKIRMYDNQYEEHFSLEKNNCFYVEYMGKTASVQVEIVQNPISGLVYTPAEEIVIYEGTNGEWDTDFQGSTYYRYYGIRFRQGDQLAVTYSDTGDTVVYTYYSNYYDEVKDMWYDGFYDNDFNEIPDREELYTCYDGIWEKGDDNFAYVRYMDNKSNNVAVSIIDNPVKGIRYEKSKNFVYFEGDTHYDQVDKRDYYNEPGFEDGDRLIVSYSDESVGTVTYIYSRETEFFVSGDRKISRYEVDIHSEQRNMPWSLGSDNEYYVEYMGYRQTLYATVIPNPVESIEYIPFETTEYLEGTMMHHDGHANKDFYERPNAQNGDKLIVNYTDPQRGRVEYTAKFNQSEDVMTFVSDTDKSDIIVVDEKFEFRDDQDVNPWQVGENYFSVFYCGKEARVPVIIVKNTITGIFYKPIKTPQVWETDFVMDTDEKTGEQYKHYNIPNFAEGDILTVYYSDMEPKDFVLTFDENDGERYFVNGDKKYHQYILFRFDNQNESEWAKEADNYYFIDFYGFITGIKVEIIDTNVESISFIPKNAIVIDENKDGEFLYDDKNNSFFFYNQSQLFNVGDKLVVTYKNDEVVEYFIYEDQQNHIFGLRSEDEREINIKEINIDDDQWNNHWLPGTNYFDFYYQGVKTRVPVTVKADHIPGDIDGNEEVDNLDVIALFQYVSGWGNEVNISALDVNGDENVDNLDVIALFQYVSGWGNTIY